jgi:hypothetical protein
MDSEPLHQKGRDELIAQDPATALGIVGEFHDIKKAIIALQQVGLRAATHFPDEPASVD